MKSYQSLNRFFLITFSLFGILAAQETTVKKYAWQHDDSALITQLPNKYTFELPELRVNADDSDRIKKPEVIAYNSKTKPTKAEKRKINEEKKRINATLKKYTDLASQSYFDREPFLKELLKLTPAQVHLMAQDPQLDTFIAHRLSKNDANTLYTSATILDVNGKQLPTQKGLTETQYQNERKSETKALEILFKIKRNIRLDTIIKTGIAEHLEFLRQNDPKLKDYYDAISSPFAGIPVVYPRLGLMPENNPLRFLEPQRVVAAPVVTPPVAMSCPASLSITQLPEPAAITAPVEKVEAAALNKIEKEEKQLPVSQMVRQYKSAYTRGNHQEAAHKAWLVIKNAPPTSDEHKQALTRLESMANKNIPNALYAMTLFHKDDHQKAISYFMKAQQVHKGQLQEEPKETKVEHTRNTLIGKQTDLVFADTPEMLESLAIMERLAQEGNQNAIQALATCYHNGAKSNPTIQLECLVGAKHYLDKINYNDPHLKYLLGFDPAHMYYNYYQQLYVFAREDDHYKLDNLVAFDLYYAATQHLACALDGLKRLSSSNIPQALKWADSAEASLKGNLYKIKYLLDSQLGTYLNSNADKYDDMQELLLAGLNAVPLCISQRIPLVRHITSTASDLPLSRSLITKSYEGSAYQAAAAQENKPYSEDYYRLLFALDCQNYETAFAHARAGAKLGDERAEIFVKNICLCTDLVFKDEGKKIPAIQNILKEITDPHKTKRTIHLYCDAIATLEQLASKNSLSAVELLIAAHCADKYHNVHYDRLMDLLNQARGLLSQSPTVTPNSTLFSKQLTPHLVYFCKSHGSIDPIYVHTLCVLDQLIKAQTPHEAGAPTHHLACIVESIQLDVQKQAGFYSKESNARTLLIAQMETFLKDEKTMAHLRKIEAHTAVITVLFSLKPHGSAQKLFNSMVQNLVALSFVNAVEETFDANTADTDALIAGVENCMNYQPKEDLADIPKASRIKTPSTQSVDLPEYANSPNNHRRCTIEETIKSKDFASYKQAFEHDKPQASAKTDALSQIQDLLLLAAHEYLIAQADSQNPLSIQEIPAAAELIQKAVSLHPYYGCLEVANAYIDDHIWPKDTATGLRYLLKASELAEKHSSKLNAQDRIYLNVTKQTYAQATAINAGFSTLNAMKLFSNKLNSSKKVA